MRDARAILPPLTGRLQALAWRQRAFLLAVTAVVAALLLGWGASGAPLPGLWHSALALGAPFAAATGLALAAGAGVIAFALAEATALPVAERGAARIALPASLLPAAMLPGMAMSALIPGALLGTLLLLHTRRRVPRPANDNRALHTVSRSQWRLPPVRDHAIEPAKQQGSGEFSHVQK